MKEHPVDWAESHRPKTLDEIIGNSSAVSQLRSWADAWSKGKPKRKGAILVGDPGIGKTSAALALANDYGWDIVELNASDSRNEESVDRIVGHGSRADTFSADGSYRSIAEGHLKLIVFDEADNLFGNEDRGGAKSITHALRDTVQPIILIVNDYYELTRKASGIKQLATTIRFTRPTAQQVADALARIATREGLNIHPDVILRVIKNADGDIRGAVNDLQSISLLGSEDMEEVSQSLGWRDVPSEIFEALADIFASNDLTAARLSLISVDETPDNFLKWLDDNLPRVIRDPEDRARAIDIVARADVFLGRTKRRQYYGLWSYASDLMSMGVCSVSGNKNPVYSDSLRFPEYIMGLSRTKAKRAAITSLLDKMAVYMHTSPQIARESIVPYFRSLFSTDKEFARECIKGMELQAGEVALLLGVESDADEVDRLLGTDIGKRGKVEEPAEEEPEGAKAVIEHQRSLFEFR
jgi:replication factor C large subunit